MTSKNPESETPVPGLQSVLAKLRDLVQPAKAAEAEPVPTADEVPDTVEDYRHPEPVAAEEVIPEAVPVEEAPADPAPAAPGPCPFCGAARVPENTYCGDCGLIYPTEEVVDAAAPQVSAAGAGLLRGRYRVEEKLGERLGVTRSRGTDLGLTGAGTAPVIVLQATPPPVAEAALPLEEIPAAEAVLDESDLLPTFEEPSAAALATAAPLAAEPLWPGLDWEQALLDRVKHQAFPRVLDRFVEGGQDYLVLEAPAGQVLWDAWDDPEADAARRFALLRQVAEALDELHRRGAILEGLRPDLVVVTPEGKARFCELADLLPLPLPPNPPIRATPYTAPELVYDAAGADARADLYGFGALLYALHVGRELSDLDFEAPGVPKHLIEHFPDIHPLFARLVGKTFVRERERRFPTEEAAREDATGFAELLRTLEVCGRTLDLCRLEVAAWTTTGMVRTGNEDAFALIHATGAGQDDLSDCALILLADGMGGYEAGEVAAALAIQALRKNLLEQKAFAALTGNPGPGPDPVTGPVEREVFKLLLNSALKEANRQVYSFARSRGRRRIMGCTAEAVYVDGRQVVVGHVGDSRTYHLRRGTLVQLTRDQTLVNRLLELGRLTPEEAENHPQKSELQQALGGHADVDPALYQADLRPGDWVVVCSDGLSNHVLPNTLRDLLLAAGSAETAARRLVNLVNLEGATDNATVVVVRAT